MVALLDCILTRLTVCNKPQLSHGSENGEEFRTRDTVEHEMVQVTAKYFTSIVYKGKLSELHFTQGVLLVVRFNLVRVC